MVRPETIRRGNGARVAQKQCSKLDGTMSWETRGNNRYYYRRRKVGGQIETEYIGSGTVADFIAKQDEHDRAQRAAAAAEWQAMVDEERQTAAIIAKVDDLVSALTVGVLLANDYHTHRRQWRKMSDFGRKSDR
jgi:hypothetical protein